MADQKSYISSQEKKTLDEGNNVSDQDKGEVAFQEPGHSPVMPQSFSMISGLGMAFSITNSWVAYLSLLGENLIYGGPQSVMLGLLVAMFIQWIITLGLSELASAFPSSGGQYHIVYILAPERYRRFAAFIIGWLSVIGWWVGSSSGVSLVAVSIFGMVSFWDETFVGAQWMVYVVYLGVVSVTFLPQYLMPKLVPKITSLALWLSLSGFIVTFIVILAMRKHSNPSSYIVQSNLGSSGWPQGFAWVLGMVNPMYAFGGTDAVVHIADEIPNPRVKIPQIMNLCMLIGACTVFPITAILMYSMTDLDAVITSALPSAELLYQATGSKPVTTFLMCWIILAYTTSVCAGWVASGRLAWAFARDGGVPFKNYFVYIDPKREFPLRTTVATIIFVCLYGLLFLASTTAFNSILTSAVLFLTLSLAIPQVLAAARGRSKYLPPRPLNLGKFGYAVNILSGILAVLVLIVACFPPSIPVSIVNMNYSSVIIVGIFGILAIFWFVSGKRNFEGPKLDFDPTLL